MPPKQTGKIICGDSLKLLPQLPDESADLILTDPPYAINYRSNRRVARPKFNHIAGDQPGDWMEEFAREAFRILKPDRHLYCFCRFDTYPRFFRAFEDANFKMKRTLIWVKDNHGSGDLRGDYAPKDEWIIFAQKGRRTLRGRRADNILEFPKVHSSQLLHPTQKPVELLRFLIEKSSEPGELVLDPFAGVLTVAEAAMDMKRCFIAIETSAVFVKTGIARLRTHSHADKYDLEFFMPAGRPRPAGNRGDEGVPPARCG